ncbi:MAG: hypothetical protein ABI792_00355 [bacterium]
MDHDFIIENLSRNVNRYSGLWSGISKEEYFWRQERGKWCLLEIYVHLYDK